MNSNHVTGLDTTPIIIPIREFGRENHRTLATLPQEPNIRSANSKRLLVTWWDREVRIWTIHKCLKRQMDEDSSSEVDGPHGRRLIAKIALQVSLPPNPHQMRVLISSAGRRVHHISRHLVRWDEACSRDHGRNQSLRFAFQIWHAQDPEAGENSNLRRLE